MVLRRALLHVVAGVLHPFYSFYARTIPFRMVKGELNPDLLAPGTNVIYVFWHSKTFLMLPLCRDLNIGVLTLKDWKNVLYDNLCRLYGYKTVPVTSFEGAAVELKNLLDSGYSIALALDGPRGPAGVPKRGAFHLSRTTGKPIVAVRVEYTRSVRVRSRWDQYELPLPFAAATFSNYGPIQVSDENLEETEQRILAHLDRP